MPIPSKRERGGKEEEKGVWRFGATGAKPAGVGAGGDGNRDQALRLGLNHRFCLRMCVCVGGGER